MAMLDYDMDRPWLTLQALLERGDRTELQRFLDELPYAETARALTYLDEEEQSKLLSIIDPEEAADIVEELVHAHAADIIEEMDANEAAAIVEEMESHHRADLLGEMDDEDVEAILAEMAPETAVEARKLLEYDEDTAGGLMATEFVVYDAHTTVADVLKDIRDNAERYSDFGVQYAYVQSTSGTLIGVVRLRDLLLARADRPLRDIMIVNPVYVDTDTSVEEICQLFDRYSFWVVPVTDAEGRLVGVVRRADAEEAVGEEHERTFLRFSGIVSGEELRSMPLRERSGRRLMWLVLNMLLSVFAASVILGHQETVERVFALVFFMPIICNMSGCSGNQAVAVSIRELALGLIKPRDYLRVWKKEAAVGVINGVVLGTAIGLVAFVLWRDTPSLGVIIGAAFALNTTVAVSLGGLIPLLLRGLGLDPALAAPPILTTLTDMCGFMLVLTFAQVALQLGWI